MTYAAAAYGGHKTHKGPEFMQQHGEYVAPYADGVANTVVDVGTGAADFSSELYNSGSEFATERILTPTTGYLGDASQYLGDNVGTPVGEAWEGTKTQFNENVYEPAEEGIGYVAKGMRSGAKGIAKTFNDYVIAPVGNGIGKAVSGMQSGYGDYQSADDKGAWAKQKFSDNVATPAGNAYGYVTDSIQSGATGIANNFNDYVYNPTGEAIGKANLKLRSAMKEGQDSLQELLSAKKDAALNWRDINNKDIKNKSNEGSD